MKILLLADASSSHTLKWANSLCERGMEIRLFSLTDPGKLNTHYNEKILITTLAYKRENIEKMGEKLWSKLRYLKALPMIKRLIKDFNPDVLHAHYATSYGFLGSLVGFKPYVVSLWGADIFDFPKKSFLTCLMVKWVLWRANKILSTSHVMAKEGNHYTSKKIEVTPFGVNLNEFIPGTPPKRKFDEGDIVIGTVKIMAPKYGISYLIKAFKLMKDLRPDLPLKLLLVGDGPQKKDLEKLAIDLGIDGDVCFTGFVPHGETPSYYQQMSIACFPSVLDSESFGVSVIEAGACDLPVVVSRVGGLPEVVEEGKTGLIVPPKDEGALANAILELATSKSLRENLGKAGRERVKLHYDWQENVSLMMSIYKRYESKAINI